MAVPFYFYELYLASFGKNFTFITYEMICNFPIVFDVFWTLFVSK